MKTSSLGSALILGLLLCIGLIGLGFQIGNSVVAFRALERTVTVKGLSEREVRANIAIWPITFNEADNDLNRLYDDIQKKNALIIAFLRNQGFPESALSTGPPSVIDKQAQGYSGSQNIKFRYSGQSTITYYLAD